MACTGLKKWRPMNRSGRLVVDARSPTVSVDVFVAKIAPSLTMSSRRPKKSRLTGSSSTIDSITRSTRARSCRWVVQHRRSRSAPWSAAVSPAERRALLAMSPSRAWLSIGINWGLVAGAFALVAWAPNPLSVVVALFVIGGRQLGFAVLMHEAAHHTLFRNHWLNDVVGNWLCAYPVWSDLYPYRAYHLQHHAKTGTAEDPDLSLAAPFPVTRASLRRKIWRDLTGQTGWKRARATFRRDLGLSQGRVRRLDFTGVRNFRGVTITNAVLLAVLVLCGH